MGHHRTIGDVGWAWTSTTNCGYARIDQCDFPTSRLNCYTRPLLQWGRSANGDGCSGVNRHSTVTHFPSPTVTHLQEGGTGGEAPPPGQPAGTIHPNPFYADHLWLPFLRCPMRRSCYSQRAGSKSDANSFLHGSSLHAFQQACHTGIAPMGCVVPPLIA